MPIYLTYIHLSPRCCSPWKPDEGLSVRSGGRSRRRPSPWFSRTDKNGWTSLKCNTLLKINPISPWRKPRICISLTQKRTLFPALPANSHDQFSFSKQICGSEGYPNQVSRIKTGFPFALAMSLTLSDRHLVSFCSTLILCYHFRLGLGPTDSCPTTFHMDSFPMSGLKDLSRLFSTTTRICATSHPRLAHSKTLERNHCDLPTYRLVSDDHQGSTSFGTGGLVSAQYQSASHFKG